MTMTAEQRAREILADEYRKDGYRQLADGVLQGQSPATIRAMLAFQAETRVDTASDRRKVNIILAELLTPLIRDMAERIEVGNRVCSLILAAVTPPTDARRSAIEEVRELIKPWVNCDGDLPDYDDPLRCVFESGVEYAVNLLAKEMKVDDWTPCDGTEEFDGDLGGTLMNIVLAAMPKDEHGDPVHPSDLPTAIRSLADRGG